MTAPSRSRDAVLGAIAGIVGGLFFASALQAKGMMSDTAGLIGLTLIHSGLGVHLAVSALAGAGYGALFRYQSGAYAAAISTGVIYGLIWWILGPLTLSPILMGQGPSWSLAEAGASFLNLTGHILFGGITGLSFHILVAAYERWFPKSLVGTAAPLPHRTRVVILGGGFGGVSTAQRLEKLTAQDENFDVALVSQSNYLLFTPMLPEVASSALQAQHISTPVRAACPYTRFIRAAVEEINTEAKTIRLRPGADLPPETLEYDHLVWSLGSVPFYHGLKGMEAHSFSLKTLEDATTLRNHVLATLERADVEPDAVEKARQLAFVVVGGGFAGTEVIAELFDLVHGVLHYYPRITPQDLRFVLVHSRDRILPELSEQLADYSLRKLRGRGIEFLLESRVTEATSVAVMLDQDRQIPTRTIVWTAGNRPNPLLQTIPCKRGPAGCGDCEQDAAGTGPRSRMGHWRLRQRPRPAGPFLSTDRSTCAQGGKNCRGQHRCDSRGQRTQRVSLPVGRITRGPGTPDGRGRDHGTAIFRTSGLASLARDIPEQTSGIGEKSAGLIRIGPWTCSSRATSP